MRLRACLALFAAFPALGASPAGDPLVAQGIRRAEDSDLHWQVREGNHPKMGPIKVAISLDAHISYIGTAKIVSTAYLSCEKSTGKIAIEIANARSIDLESGLKTKEAPHLACLGVAPPGEPPPRSRIAATWEANELGDMLTRGLSPSALRACVGIEVSEKIALPAALGRDVEPVTFEIPTYARGPDAIFAACGEPSAYAPPAPVVAQAPPAPPVAAPPAPPALPQQMAAPEPTWKRAHTLAKGRSNIRKAPSISSPVVAQLPPGVKILVEEDVDDWWHVKSPSGARFEGFIRRDRFTLD